MGKDAARRADVSCGLVLISRRVETVPKELLTNELPLNVLITDN